MENENPEDFIDPDTPNGRKKLLAPQMAKQYSPSAVEKSYDVLFFFAFVDFITPSTVNI